MAGRPPGITQDSHLHMRVAKEFLARVDEWRRTQPDLPPRAEAIRRLVELGLKRGRRGAMPVLGARED